jgi:hypothetical protein
MPCTVADVKRLSNGSDLNLKRALSGPSLGRTGVFLASVGGDH